MILVGWFADVPILRRYGPGLPETKANTALCLLLLAGAQLLSRRGRTAGTIGAVLAIAAGGVAGVTLAEWFLDGALDIDFLLVSGSGPGHPGRMSPQSAITLLVLAGAILLRQWWAAGWWLPQAAFIAVIVSGIGALIGLWFGVPQVWNPATVVGMSVPSALCLLGFGLAGLCSVPERGPASLLATSGAGGWTARVLLPVMLPLPVIIAALLHVARARLAVTDAEAWSLLAVTSIVLSTVAILLVAAALERTESRRQAAVVHAERARARLGLLAEVGALVAESTRESMLRECGVELLATRLGCWCGMLQPDETKTLVLTAAAPAGDPAGDPGDGDAGCCLGTGDAAGSSSRGAAPLGALVVDQRHPALIAWRAGRTVRAEWCDDSDQACCADTSHALARTRSRMPSGPAVAVPLVARGETVGVLTLVDAEGCRPLEAEDEQILADVGRRVGAALDNLRLLAIRTRVAARLQESLLPQRLPAVSQAELAVRYLTGDDGADVGGDFYDAFPLGADEYAFVIGDVSGRGADAAGLTGLARATLRALDASVGPAGALARLNELLIGRSDGERFLTAAYLRIGPRTETGATATVCLAGHPRPVVVGPTGAIRWVGTPGTLLGVFDQPPLTDQTVRLSPGDTVLLYTDGVIEAKGPEGLFGEDRLAAVLAPLAGRSAEDVVTDIERAILEYRDSASDDTALLALRLLSPRESGQRVLADLHLSADPSTAKAARHAVAGLGGRAFPRELTDDLLLAVSELVTNAIRQLERQPTRTLRSDPIQLRVLQRPGMLRVEIHNPGSTFSLPVNLSVPDPTTERGRGLVVVRALSNRMGVDTSSGATCVWFEIDVPAGTALDGTTCRGQHLPGQAARHAWGPTPSP